MNDENIEIVKAWIDSLTDLALSKHSMKVSEYDRELEALARGLIDICGIDKDKQA